MADEPEQIIFGDTAISAIEGGPRDRRFFRRKDRQSPPLTHCENCGGLLHGHWCAQCGQPAIDYRRSFRHVILDVLDSFLNWDSKFFATIGLLVAKPWRLTNEFVSGRRVRYLHPLRLYLLASILFFFAVNYWAKGIHTDPNGLSRKDRAEIEADLQKENLPPEARERIRKVLNDSAPSPSPATAQTGQSPVAPKREEPVATDKETKQTTPFGRWMEARAQEKMGEHGTKMGLFIKTLISNLPYMMFCCIPLFAVVLKILYLRRRVLYIDHLIYALHIHTFVYVATTLIGIITMGLLYAMPGALAGWVIGVLWTAFAVQIFLSIRRVYRQRWFISIFKFFLGGLVYLVVLFVAVTATFVVTILLP